jgi:hypothetical protein
LLHLLHLLLVLLHLHQPLLLLLVVVVVVMVLLLLLLLLLLSLLSLLRVAGHEGLLRVGAVEGRDHVNSVSWKAAGAVWVVQAMLLLHHPVIEAVGIRHPLCWHLAAVRGHTPRVTTGGHALHTCVLLGVVSRPDNIALVPLSVHTHGHLDRLAAVSLPCVADLKEVTYVHMGRASVVVL